MRIEWSRKSENGRRRTRNYLLLLCRVHLFAFFFVVQCFGFQWNRRRFPHERRVSGELLLPFVSVFQVGGRRGWGRRKERTPRLRPRLPRLHFHRLFRNVDFHCAAASGSSSSSSSSSTVLRSLKKFPAKNLIHYGIGHRKNAIEDYHLRDFAFFP